LPLLLKVFGKAFMTTPFQILVTLLAEILVEQTIKEQSEVLAQHEQSINNIDSSSEVQNYTDSSL
jgi:hypothetical protein